jgi:hypothetical protein
MAEEGKEDGRIERIKHSPFALQGQAGMKGPILTKANRLISRPI